jgi:hypothetical protein
VKKAFVLGFYENVQSFLSQELGAQIGISILWFGKKSSHEPFQIDRFRSHFQQELKNPSPDECFVILAHLTREAWVLEAVKGIVGATHAVQIQAINNLEDSAWLAATLRNLGFGQQGDQLDFGAISRYFCESDWKCLCVRPQFQTSYLEGLQRAGFPEESMSHFIERIEEHNSKTVQRVLREAQAYSGLMYAHKGLKYMPPSARAELRTKRFHEDTTTVRVIDKLRLAILTNPSTPD